jgi:amidase
MSLDRLGRNRLQRYQSSAYRALAGMVALGVSSIVPAAHVPSNPTYNVEEKSIREIQADLTAGVVSSEQLVQAYCNRITSIDRSGPTLRSVISINRAALLEARRLDAERAAGHVRGPLHGIPILIKDNIESSDDTATTVGSLALVANITHRDATVIRRIKDAGGIILGKNNLAEWALIRSQQPIDGWSAVGGLVKNPYVLDRSPCGSSSGTGAAIAASLATVGVGTETDGSITCPAAYNSLVGLKPTVGLVSRTWIVPVSRVQDTPGPMGRSVEDVAILLSVMAGTDPDDTATFPADAHKRDYAMDLMGASLAGKRLGVLRNETGYLAAVDAIFEQSLATLRSLGVAIIEITDFKPPEDLWARELFALHTEFKHDIDEYLSSTPQLVTTRTLADVIHFNQASPTELALFGQEGFDAAESTTGPDDPNYIGVRESLKRDAATNGIDSLILNNRLDALIAPSFGPAYRSDVVTGRHEAGDAASLPAIAGYPHLTVPMGFIRGLPVGISFIGRAWSEKQLLDIGFAFERATRARRPPSYKSSLENSPQVSRAFQPMRATD